MGIGRSFQEALHKAAQSLEDATKRDWAQTAKALSDQDEILHKLEYASSDRLFVIYDAIQMGIPVRTIYDITRIDMWFLKEVGDLSKVQSRIEKHSLDSLPKELIQEAKMKGFADRQIAHMVRALESEVHQKGAELGIKRVWKLVDTCAAAEFPAQTPYYYSTF